MSHHRTYEETYKDTAKGKVSDEGKQPEEKPMNPKFGDHDKGILEHKREGNGDQLDRHAVIGSLDKKDKAIEHDIMLGDEKVPGGMDYIG